MIESIWWSSAWAISGGAPFSWTVSFSGLGSRTVLAEVALAKVALPAGGHAKAAVVGADYGAIYTGTGVTSLTNDWGFDGAPVRWVTEAKNIRCGIEVNGAGTYGWMVGKLYFFN